LELQALYSRAVSTFFKVNLGVRRDVRPQPGRSFAVVGLEGVAPYLFELDAQVFASDDGDLSARLEAEYEILLSQRLILQPRTEIDVAAHEVSELGIGTGLNTVEAGLRLRYEIAREFAPYIGVAWKRKFGETEDFARDEGETVSSTSLVAGVRVWF
jgi:copper resistance protein B